MEFFLVFFFFCTTCFRSYIMYKFCDVYYSMNIPDSFMQCVWFVIRSVVIFIKLQCMLLIF